MRIGAGGPLSLGALLLASCGSPTETADLVLRHGKVVTMDDAKPEAAAVAVKGDRILAVGTDDEIAGYIGPSTQVMDLEGKLAIPGFIEAHGHFTGLGDSLMVLRLADTKSWDEIVAMVGAAAKNAPLVRLCAAC